MIAFGGVKGDKEDVSAGVSVGDLGIGMGMDGWDMVFKKSEENAICLGSFVLELV